MRNLIHILLVLFLGAASTCYGGSTEETYLKTQVLSGNILWSGSITIEGVIVVGRTAKLTIEPGTTIAFKRVDTNNDGIGDSEIRVLGQIIAEGTPESPIIFKSAETTPAPKDWSYLLLFTSGEKNSIRHCRFSDAFTGLQVHFSTALIQDCSFENNLEGIRFGRAKIIIEHNHITNNSIGIRFTRMEGPAEIRRNNVIKNDVGIFIVPSGQNIMDFFEPGRTGKAWNDGHLAIYGNNIYDNSSYNLKLGEKQMWNLNVSKNWWGTSSHKAIKTTIFDRHRDKDLGQALLLPILLNNEPEAGPRLRNKQ